MQLLEKATSLKISDVIPDAECEEYDGHNFRLDGRDVKYRKAKITPKKIGQFVTLWKRNAAGQTVPFVEEDDFDFYLIAVERDEMFGFFLFPKRVLVERQILSSANKEGKRGFRLYAEWDNPESRHAAQTKGWQCEYFIRLDNEEKMYSEKFDLIFKF